MKKTIIALVALSGLASAEVILSTDFTSVSSTPDGWTEGQWNGSYFPCYDYTDLGASINYSWKQNHLDHAVTLTSNETYTIEFEMVNKAQGGNMFYLTSSTYSILIGQAYDANPGVSVGTLAGPMDKFVCFNGNPNRPDVVLAKSPNYAWGTAAAPVTMSYTVTISAGELTVSVTNGTTSWDSGKLSIADDFQFTGVGFINDADAGCSITKSITITGTPEPATATLSLLALAGLCARRRRR